MLRARGSREMSLSLRVVFFMWTWISSEVNNLWYLIVNNINYVKEIIDQLYHILTLADLEQMQSFLINVYLTK
jgi:hypothetical protein